MLRTEKVKHSWLVNESPIFYGWVIWAVATVAMLATSPGQSFSVSLFTDNFIADFNLDRTTVSGLYGLGTFIASLSLTWVGRRIDQFGNRLTGVLIGMLFALALIAMSQVSGPIPLLIGFIAIRGLGQGSLSLNSSTAIAQWFEKRRGRVMSLTVVAFLLFQGVYVPMVQSLLETMEWRQVWTVLGIGVGVLVPMLTWLFIRNKPEDFGLHPDGEVMTQQQEEEANARSLENSWNLRQAMTTPIFWVYTFGRILPPAWGTGLIFHQISLFAEQGHDATVVAQTFSFYAIISATVALIAGIIADRFKSAYLMMMQMVALMIATTVATSMRESWLLWVYAIAFGFSMGSGGVFDGAVWPRLFGRAHLGSIRGFITTTAVAGTSAGPILFGLSFDNLGGYAPALWLGFVLCAIVLIMSPFVKEPEGRPT